MKIEAPSQAKSKIRVNIIVYKKVWDMFNANVQPGKRSEYISQLIENDLKQQSRKEAADYIKKLRETDPLIATTKEIIRLKNYGRK